jgi:hypothetical protein
MNWAILVGILITAAVSRSRPNLAGWLGLALTTVILIWGLTIYSQGGSAVGFLGIPLPKMVFLALIGLFYGVNLAQVTRPTTTRRK